MRAQYRIGTTTIIFLGDNGTDSNVIQPPYDISGRAKGSLHEGGTHVPFLIYGADVVNGGRTNDSVIHCADLFATILELAGGTMPTIGGEDSRSLVPVIKDQAFHPADDCILMETDILFGGTTSGRAICDSQYKLIRIEGSSDLLFDMVADPLETNNLLAGSLTVDEQTANDNLTNKLARSINFPHLHACYMDVDEKVNVEVGWFHHEGLSLYRTENLLSNDWTVVVGQEFEDNGAHTLILRDPSPPVSNAYYRVTTP